MPSPNRPDAEHAPADDPRDAAEPLGPLIVEAHTERPLWLRVALVLAALLAFVLGVVGWLVPVVTGVPFYVIGLVCLAKVSPWMAARVNDLDARLPEGVRRALRWRPRWLRGDDAARASDASSPDDHAAD